MIKSYKINKGYNLILDGEPERIIDNIETDKINTVPVHVYSIALNSGLGQGSL